MLELSVISYDGNYFDALNFAAIAALLKYKHKVALEIGESLKFYEESEKSKKGFILNQIPCLFTFAILNDDKLDSVSAGDVLLMDPSVI